MYFSVSFITLLVTVAALVAVVEPAPIQSVRSFSPPSTLRPASSIANPALSDNDITDGGEDSNTKDGDFFPPGTGDGNPAVGDDQDSNLRSSGSDQNPVWTGTSKSTSLFPRFVIYTDKTVTHGDHGLPAAADLKGYNTLNLGFLTSWVAEDQSGVWAALEKNERDTLKRRYAAAGIKVMVSAFGGTETPTTRRVDPIKMATIHADFVRDNNLDGIDVDYEDLAAFSAGTAVAWMISYMRTLRNRLPSPFLISHAPLAPHFSPNFPEGSAEAQGPYLQIHKSVGHLIDWYNVQFYNDKTYADCNSMITKSTVFPGSALLQIAHSGVELNKLVIGKPIHKDDAVNGLMSPVELAECVTQAIETNRRYRGGIMGFEFTDALTANAFVGPSVQAFRGNSFGGSEQTTTDEPTTTFSDNLPEADSTNDTTFIDNLTEAGVSTKDPISTDDRKLATDEPNENLNDVSKSTGSVPPDDSTDNTFTGDAETGSLNELISTDGPSDPGGTEVSTTESAVGSPTKTDASRDSFTFLETAGISATAIGADPSATATSIHKSKESKASSSAAMSIADPTWGPSSTPTGSPVTRTKPKATSIDATANTSTMDPTGAVPRANFTAVPARRRMRQIQRS